jgi:hypothetical protein
VIENVGFSSRQLEEDVVNLTDQIVDITGGDTPISVAAAPATGTFNVTVYDSAQPSARSSQPSPFDALETNSPLKPNVQFSKAEPSTTAYGRHGGTWLINQAGQGQCTGGFVAKSTSSSALGLLTAGHCPTPLRYYNVQNGEVVGLTTGAGGFGSSGDARFLQSPVMMDAWFLADHNLGKPVLEARNPVSGERVCRFGARTDSDLCGNIIAVITSYYVEGRSVGGVASARMWNNGGDSGGPVYGGNTAMGLMSGTLFINGQPDKSSNQTLWFTKIDNAEALTGTKVCLDPVCR